MPTINGVAYDGGCVEMRWNASAFAVQEANHEDSLVISDVRAVGNQAAHADTPGAYTVADDTVKMETAEAARLLAAMPANGYGSVRFTQVFDYTHPDLGTMHVVKENCRIIGVKGGFKEGSDATMVEFKIHSRQIIINGKTLNKRKGTATSAANNALKL